MPSTLMTDGFYHKEAFKIKKCNLCKFLIQYNHASNMFVSDRHVTVETL